MLTIRLARIGKKKQPIYRLIINEKTKDTLGDFLENLGTYNPKTKEINLKTERINHWLSKGAGTSDTVQNLLVNQGVIKDKKVKSWRPKKKTSGAEGEAKAPSTGAKATGAGEEKSKEESPNEKKPEEIKSEEKPKVEKPKEETKPETPKEEPKEEPKPEEPKPEVKSEEPEKINENKEIK